MKIYRLSSIIMLCLLVLQAVVARDVMHYKRYTVQDGLSHRLISGMAQDTVGNIWLSTWNGLCKFNGETFTTYNQIVTGEKVGRLSLVRITREGQVWVVRHSDSQEFLFHTSSCQFEPIVHGSVRHLPVRRLPKEVIPNSSGLILTHDSITYCIPYVGTGGSSNTNFNSLIDKQGTVWANFDDALYQITFSKATYLHHEYIDPQQCGDARYGNEVRALLPLREGGFLLGCRNNCVYVYNQDWHYEGCLTGQGQIQSAQSPFCSYCIYCMVQTADGSLWLGSRGAGLFQISTSKQGGHSCVRGSKSSVVSWGEEILGSNHIYDLASLDSTHLLVGTWDGGIRLLSIDPFGNVTPTFSNEKIRKVRRIKVLNANLIALCSTQGLFLVDRQLHELKQLGTMDVSDLCQGADGTYYVSSLSNGVFMFNMDEHPDQIALESLKLEELDIPDMDNVIVSIAQTPDSFLWFVSDNRLIKYNPLCRSTQVIDQNALGTDVIFGEAQPMVLSDGLILGTHVGRMHIDLEASESYCPNLVFDLADTLRTEWGQELPEIHVTALDYRLPRMVKYAWREYPDSTWHLLGSNGTLQLKSLLPGTHTFEFRSTDACENWFDNIRPLVIVVGFTPIQKALIGSFVVLLLLFCYWGWKVRRPVLVMESPSHPISSGIQPTLPVVIERNQLFINQVTKIVEEHIADPKLDVELLTSNMNISRTILYAKFKELLDSTPASFVTEIRLKRAVQLLDSRQYRIGEVAVMCGFSDPKYFTRLFKQKMGMTPAKYLESLDDKANFTD